MLLKLLRRWAPFLAVPALAGCATVPAQQSVAEATVRPALWQVSDPDTNIYLFGTIHLLPKGYQWRTRALDQAIASSDTLVVETIIDPANPQPLVQELMRLGYANDLPPLASRISPEKRPQLEAAIAKTGLPRAAFDKMRTWAAAFTLLGVQYKELGIQGESGVEENLRNAFLAAGKPIGQLETNGEQLGFFNDLPEHAERELLESAIDTPAQAKEDFSKMLRGWATGDVSAIANAFHGELVDSPELLDALITRRNANWSRWVEQRLAAPGTVFLAVGAGHLAGPGSLQDLLESRGYRVKRVQ